MNEISRPRAAKTATSETTTTPHHGDRAYPNSSLVLADSRCRARLTETGLTAIDVALTFTGLAAEMRQVADR
jgi:hypothetical protein